MRSRGFTLVEALVSVVLLGVGVVGCLQALSEMTKSESRIRESAQLRALALEKLDEVIATGELIQAPLEGDLADRGAPDISYTIESEPGTVESMLIVRVSAYFTVQGEDSAYRFTTMLYQAPVTTEPAQGNRP